MTGQGNLLSSEEGLDTKFASMLQEMWRYKYSDILARVRTSQQSALQNIFLDVLAYETSKSSPNEAKGPMLPHLDSSRAYERMNTFLKRQSDRRTRQALGSKREFEKRYEADERLRQTVGQIDIVETSIEEEMRPIELLSKLISKLFSAGKSISFDGPTIRVQTQDKTEIGLEALSSGEKHLIRILLAAMDAQESTLLIDEPELSLHIDWQRELIRNIRLLNPMCQLIIATHSPEIMADVSDSEIFRI